MCEIASANTGLEARHLLFEDLDYVDEFDGIWACSSLLHVPSTGLKDIFRLVHKALKSNGVFYCSFKYGTYEGERDGRYFTDLTEDSIAELMDRLFQPLRIWITDDNSRISTDDDCRPLATPKGKIRVQHESCK